MIELKNISKNYIVGEEAIPALKKVYLKVEEGELLVIVGPSGSGKSTLLHLIAGLDHPSGGTVLVNGKNLKKLNDKNLSDYRNRQVGMIFQDFKLHPHLTNLENVQLPLFFNKKKLFKLIGTKRKAKKILVELGLKDRLTHKPGQISGGQKQRVAIARALINNPPLLLADEPTGNVDSITGKEIIHTLQKLHKDKKMTMIIVTHDKNLAKYATRTIEIRDGKLILSNKFEKFMN